MSGEPDSRPRKSLVRRVSWGILVGGILLLVPLERALDRAAGPSGQGRDVLYLPSGAVLRRLSLGHEGLLADIYWTRAVQYFGRQRLAHSTQFNLLGPLLRLSLIHI